MKIDRPSPPVTRGVTELMYVGDVTQEPGTATIDLTMGAIAAGAYYLSSKAKDPGVKLVGGSVALFALWKTFKFT